jgi:hypothetical protein
MRECVQKVQLQSHRLYLTRSFTPLLQVISFIKKMKKEKKEKTLALEFKMAAPFQMSMKKRKREKVRKKDAPTFSRLSFSSVAGHIDRLFSGSTITFSVGKGRLPFLFLLVPVVVVCVAHATKMQALSG